MPTWSPVKFFGRKCRKSLIILCQMKKSCYDSARECLSFSNYLFTSGNPGSVRPFLAKASKGCCKARPRPPSFSLLLSRPRTPLKSRSNSREKCTKIETVSGFSKLMLFGGKCAYFSHFRVEAFFSLSMVTLNSFS